MTIPAVDRSEEFDAKSAAPFLTLLNPLLGLWDPDPSSWIFRGQADQEWPLLAKAHRKEDHFIKFGIRRDLGNGAAASA